MIFWNKLQDRLKDSLDFLHCSDQLRKQIKVNLIFFTNQIYSPWSLAAILFSLDPATKLTFLCFYKLPPKASNLRLNKSPQRLKHPCGGWD